MTRVTVAILLVFPRKKPRENMRGTKGEKEAGKKI